MSGLVLDRRFVCLWWQDNCEEKGEDQGMPHAPAEVVLFCLRQHLFSLERTHAELSEMLNGYLVVVAGER